MDLVIFAAIHDRQHLFKEISYFLLITPLIFRHQQVYGFLLTFPVLAFCIYSIMLEKRAGTGLNAAKIVFVLAVIIINLELFLGFTHLWLWHYKTLTYGNTTTCGSFDAF